MTAPFPRPSGPGVARVASAARAFRAWVEVSADRAIAPLRIVADLAPGARRRLLPYRQASSRSLWALTMRRTPRPGVPSSTSRSF